MDIQADLPDSRNGYNITSYFRSAYIEVERQQKMPSPTALRRILVAWRFDALLVIQMAFSSYVMTSVGRRHSSTYITTRAARISQQRFDLESSNLMADIHTDPLFSRTGYDVTSCFWSA